MIDFDKFEKHDDGEIVSNSGRWISFYEDGDTVTLDGSFTIDELRQLVEHLEKVIKTKT